MTDGSQMRGGGSSKWPADSAKKDTGRQRGGRKPKEEPMKLTLYANLALGAMALLQGRSYQTTLMGGRGGGH